MVSWSELIAPVPFNREQNGPDKLGTNTGIWDEIEELDVGLALWSPDGVLLHCNPAFQSAFGHGSAVCQPGIAIQQILLFACMNEAHPRTRNDWVDNFVRAFQDGSSFEWRSPSGQWWRAKFWNRSNGNHLCRLIDVSAEKRLAQEARQLASIQSADNPLAKGLAHMGHELRTPLNAILGFADLIRSEAIGPIGQPSYKDYAHDIFNSGQLLLTAVDRIALLVKLEAGLIRPQSAPVTSKEVARTAIEEIAPWASAADVTIKDLTDDTAPSLFLDQSLLTSVLVHLLENAVAATEAGGAVELRCSGSAAEGVVFDVKDEGKGIPADQLTAIREPFVRLDSANPAIAVGVGMGLPLADRIAALLNCSITLESAPNTGTKARLRVPGDRIVV